MDRVGITNKNHHARMHKDKDRPFNIVKKRDFSHTDWGGGNARTLSTSCMPKFVNYYRLFRESNSRKSRENRKKTTGKHHKTPEAAIPAQVKLQDKKKAKPGEVQGTKKQALGIIFIVIHECLTSLERIVMLQLYS